MHRLLPATLSPRPLSCEALPHRPARTQPAPGYAPSWAQNGMDDATRQQVEAHLRHRALWNPARGWPLDLGLDPGLGPERCSLTLWQGQAWARAGDEGGLHRVVEVLAALEGAGPGPALQVEDQPRHAWRGLMLDCSRHFWPVPVVRRVLDEVARHGGNRLHLHLTDDQGWRLPLPGRPELEELGAWRVERDGQRHGGSYSREDLRFLVQQAVELGVEILPEVDLPGHCGALLAALPQLACPGPRRGVPRAWGCHDALLCLGNPQLPDFLDEVLDGLTAIFPFPHIHLGGDEVAHDAWLRCPRCRQRLQDLGGGDPARLAGDWIRLAEQRLRAHQRRGAYWDEALEHVEEPGALIFAWRGTAAIRRALGQGHLTVACPLHPCYLDFYPGLEAGQARAIGGHNAWQALRAFDPRALEGDASAPPASGCASGTLVGGQGNLWTEYVEDEFLLMQRLQPRLSALMEALWCGPEPESGQAGGFAHRLPDLVGSQWDRGFQGRVDPPRLLDPELALPGQELTVRLALWPGGRVEELKAGSWGELKSDVAPSEAGSIALSLPHQESRRQLILRQALPGTARSAPWELVLRREEPWPVWSGEAPRQPLQVEAHWLCAPRSDWRTVARDSRLPSFSLPDWQWPQTFWQELPALERILEAGLPWIAEVPTPPLPEIVPAGLRRGLQRVGWLAVPATGRWRFSVASYSLARLWVDGHLVLELDGFRPGGLLEGLLPLEAGLHQLRLDWLDLRGGTCSLAMASLDT